MEKFIVEFKKNARAKEVSSADMLALCIYRAIKAKSENKLEVANYFVRKAFRARNDGSVLGFYRAQNTLHVLTHSTKKLIYVTGSNILSEWVDKPRSLLNIPLDEIFTTEEIKLFDELMWKVSL